LFASFVTIHAPRTLLQHASNTITVGNIICRTVFYTLVQCCFHCRGHPRFEILQDQKVKSVGQRETYKAHKWIHRSRYSVVY
jgi:hypothetical protein